MTTLNSSNTSVSLLNLTNMATITHFDPQLDYDFIRFKIRLWKVTHGYIMFIFIMLGIIGNILSLVVLLRKTVRKATVSVYLRALVISDTFVLITAFFRYETYKLFLTEEQAVPLEFNFNAYVQVYVEPLHWLSLGLSSFVILILTTERFLAIKYPISVKTACKKSLVRMCIVAIFVVVTMITLPLIFSYKVTKLTVLNTTIHFQDLTTMGSNTLYPCMYHIYIVPFLWYIIPWIILALLNTMIFMHVKKSSKIRPKIPKISNPNRRLSILIITIVLVYMVCNLPSCIMVIYKLAHHKVDNKDCIKETTSLAFQTSRQFLVVQAITGLFNILNSCMNIIVYCLLGTKFRREIKKVFNCAKLQNNNKISPTTGASIFKTRTTGQNAYQENTGASTSQASWWSRSRSILMKQICLHQFEAMEPKQPDNDIEILRQLSFNLYFSLHCFLSHEFPKIKFICFIKQFAKGQDSKY